MRRWLFSPTIDLSLFLGTALASVVIAWLLGNELSPWAWVCLVVGIDVAHVWSTILKTYLDTAELKRRPTLYLLAPAGAFAVSCPLYSISSGWFWTALAYTAAWHFVRQQVGFFQLYERLSPASKAYKMSGTVAMYSATLGPLVWWHAHLPRAFWWMKENDFLIQIPQVMGSIALVLTGISAGLFLLFSLLKQEFHTGKTALLAATLISWIGGIVLAQSDATFTAMNVMLHGIPYVYLLFRYAKGRARDDGFVLAKRILKSGFVLFIIVLFVLAYSEEFLWDVLVWHEHPEFFGSGGFEVEPSWLALLIPLLSLPQTTHYVLDGFIWRGQDNPDNARRIFA
jgi:hypothetical protein